VSLLFLIIHVNIILNGYYFLKQDNKPQKIEFTPNLWKGVNCIKHVCSSLIW
jgi:hypothetical protein